MVINVKATRRRIFDPSMNRQSHIRKTVSTGMTSANKQMNHFIPTKHHCTPSCSM
uniref:Uncharacterized protein n=1 Tax=Arion vulgaris TaxID=1028688 RepID=A0A0B6ZN69_9EUPU